MTAVLFDTLALARKLEEAGFPSQQAQATSAAFAEILSGEVATTRDVDESRVSIEHQIESVRHGLDAKIESARQELDAKIESVRQDLEARIDALDVKIESVRQELDARIDQLEQRLTIRLGGMMAAAVGLVAVLVRLL